MLRFDDLQLGAALLAAIRDAGYASPTAIQAKAIPLILSGRDVLGCAQTGTGKTAAFVLPLVQRLAASASRRSGARPLRTLVLSPTRELATQIAEAFASFGTPFGLETTAVYGGVSDVPQRRALRRGADVLVATPGRLEDLMSAGEVDLRRVEAVVLDEADRMLDAGFVASVRRILSRVPAQRQTLLFSATMPAEIRSLARSVQRDAAEVEVAPVATPAEKVEQEVLFVARGDKRALLSHLLADPAVKRALVFTRTKRGADRVAKHLCAGERAEAIHGNRSQAQRERALASFKRGSTRVLVATDLAARGIDVDDISHVINYELPDDCESYVHRIGRTGRAAASGIALSLCDAGERDQLRRIERLMRRAIPVRREHPFVSAAGTADHARTHAPRGATRTQASTGRARERVGHARRVQQGRA
ncbi:MAG: DEAD/DEAH box helicase [Deltaproteobacteria bacterium]|nr:DEAD/DEAH box helicase [Deltaproteobacteria bacterium]